MSRISTAESAPKLAQASLVRLAQRLDALDHDLLALQDRARVLQEEIASQLASETNRQLYILTTLGTLTMPPTLIAGLFGMNLKGITWAEEPNGFVLVILLCLVASALTYALVRKLQRGPAQ